MRKLFFVIAFFAMLKGNAQNYLISFAGTGATTSVTTVRVDNLTTGSTLTVSGSDILRLTSATDVNIHRNKQLSDLNIYPNPMTDNSTIQVFPLIAGNAIITLFDMTGKKLTQIQSYLENSLQEFKLTGVSNGLYLVSEQGPNYHYSGKLLSNGAVSGKIQLVKISGNIISSDEKPSDTPPKGEVSTVDMQYSAGNILKFTGISGNYSTVVTDVPALDKTISFRFIACTDADNINYPVVELGAQFWMAENLKTAKYRTGDDIGTTTPASLDISGESTPKYQWAPGNSESNVATYGRLYTWFAATDSRNVCPTGWHLPSDAEWSTLTTWLGGAPTAGGKLKETTNLHWDAPNEGATNEKGFTALPGGYRNANGSFFDIRVAGDWWTSSEYNANDALFRSIGNTYVHVYSYWMGTSKKRGHSVRCVIGSTPSVSTSSVTTFTSSSATLGGNVASDGNATVSERGVYWGTSPNAETTGTKLQIGTGTGIFSSSVSGLNPLTTYYVKAYAKNSYGTIFGEEVSFKTPLSIGDSYQGGKVAYILQPGNAGYDANVLHGLVAAAADQSPGAIWYTGSFNLLGATGEAIGTGNANTNIIVSALGAGGYAARLCYDLSLNGYTDWYLPSRYELEKLYQNKTLIGGFSDGAYWSSTEYTKFDAMYQILTNGGGWGNTMKSDSYKVRAIRSF